MNEFTLPSGETATDEEWRFIPGLAEGYAISNNGRVISYRRRMPAFMAWNVNHLRGYYASVVLAHPETRVHTRHRIHALVLEAFVGPRPEGLDIRHLDGNPLNNRLSNLAYGTRHENMQDTLIHGTHSNLRKTECKYGHPFDDENTSLDANGRRGCRQCARDRYAANAEANAQRARDYRSRNRSEYNRHVRELRHAKAALNAAG